VVSLKDRSLLISANKSGDLIPDSIILELALCRGHQLLHPAAEHKVKA
jgi:hypothetical protein